MSPGIRHLKSNLLGKDGALATLKHAQQLTLGDIDKFGGRRNTVAPNN